MYMSLHDFYKNDISLETFVRASYLFMTLCCDDKYNDLLNVYDKGSMYINHLKSVCFAILCKWI